MIHIACGVIIDDDELVTTSHSSFNPDLVGTDIFSCFVSNTENVEEREKSSR